VWLIRGSQLSQPLRGHGGDGSLKVVGGDETGHGDADHGVARGQDRVRNSAGFTADDEVDAAREVDVPGRDVAGVFDRQQAPAPLRGLCEHAVRGPEEHGHEAVGPHGGPQRRPARVAVEVRIDEDAAGAAHFGGADGHARISRVGDTHQVPGRAIAAEDVLGVGIRRGAHETEGIARATALLQPLEVARADALHRDAGGSRATEQRRHAGVVRLAAHDDPPQRLPALQRRLDGGGAQELSADAQDPSLTRRTK
jgi:hypothetical protein